MSQKELRQSAYLVIYLYNRNCSVQIPHLRCKGKNIRASILADLKIPQTSLWALMKTWQGEVKLKKKKKKISSNNQAANC